MSHIFISYSHQDNDYAHLLATSLEQAGFTVWIDDRIDYGTSWPHVIQEYLDSCAAFIVIMTPRSYQSTWVQNELNYAMGDGKPIFPLLLEGKRWLSVASIQYTDVNGAVLPPPRFYDALARVAPRRTAVQETASANVTSPPKEQNKGLKPLVPIPTNSTFTLPLLEWVAIPGGQVTIEGKVYTVEPFHIAKYPVTNTQYKVFIDAPDGYRNVQWWNYSEYARTWHEENPQPLISHFKGQKRPRERVTWYECVAFCRWLSYKTGLSITLPTEQQWQRAAQGDDNRAYPWGNEFDQNKCNSGESGIGQTTDVDRYPDGVSPCGVYDLSGNVWEWCLNEYESGEVNISSSEWCSLRGGSWYDSLDDARAAFRSPYSPDDRSYYVGFRVVVVGLGRPPSLSH